MCSPGNDPVFAAIADIYLEGGREAVRSAAGTTEPTEEEMEKTLDEIVENDETAPSSRQ